MKRAVFFPEPRPAEPGLVSVVIATYNMARFLPAAVESVLGQTYPRWELHVVDDGSEDETSFHMKRYLHDSRIHYHRQSNRGQAAAKNAGIQFSEGAFVAFLDADDIWLPNKLEKQLPLFERSQETGVVYSRFFCMDENARALPLTRHRCHRGWITGRLLVENFVPFNTTVVRRTCLEKLGGFDESYRMGIDYDLWLRLSTRYQFDYVGEPTIRYRIWSGQMSSEGLRRYESAFAIMNHFLDQHEGLVDQTTVNEAWAHTLAGRGDCWAYQMGDRGRAFRDYVTALKHRPSYLPAWRGIAKVLLRR